MVDVERGPRPLGRLAVVLAARLLLGETREHRLAGRVVAGAVLVHPSLVARVEVGPVGLCCGVGSGHLEDGGLGGMIGHRILDVATQTDDDVVEEVVRLACAERAVVLVVLVELEAEVAVAAELRQSACEGLIGDEHLLDARRDVDVAYLGLKLVEGQVDGGDARDAVPVEAVLHPSAGLRRYGLVGGTGEELQRTVAEVTAVAVLVDVMLSAPEVAALTAHHGGPIAATLHRDAGVAQREVALRVGLRHAAALGEVGEEFLLER